MVLSLHQILMILCVLKSVLWFASFSVQHISVKAKQICKRGWRPKPLYCIYAVDVTVLFKVLCFCCDT